MSATASTVAHMARSMIGSPEVSAMSLDVVVESPLVNLPTSAGASDGFLRIPVSDTVACFMFKLHLQAHAQLHWVALSKCS